MARASLLADSRTVMPPSSSGLGRRVLIPVTGVRVPLGVVPSPVQNSGESKVESRARQKSLTNVVKAVKFDKTTFYCGLLLHFQLLKRNLILTEWTNTTVR